MVSGRVRRIGFSPTLAVSDLARRLRADGVDVLDFSAGQPDFPTPDPVKQAGKRAIDENKTGYTATAGVVELRQAIAERIERDLGVEYGADQILVSPGAKASLYFACLALLDDGDEAIIPSPYWTSYPEQVRLAGGQPRFVECREENGFKLSAAELEAAVTPKTRVVFLNYPSNPTGACYTIEELRPLGEACARHDLWILADEIYSKLIFDGRSFGSLTQLGPEIRDRTILIDGVSKTYSMTGWRIGYAAGPREVISGMGKMQSHSTSNPTSISQWASLEAVGMPDRELAPRTAEFERRRDEIVRRLRELPGISCVQPEGAFYAFPNVSAYLDRGGDTALKSPADLCRYLLERAEVALVPGEAFGSSKHLRISYAVSMDRIGVGMTRIAEALSAL